MYGADLSGADLSGADLTGAHLTDATLTGVTLSNAHLSGANLTSANMSDSDLSGAILTLSDLRGAVLRDAKLNSANLSGAFLNGANLSGADLSDTDLSSADLSSGLNTPVTMSQPQLDEVHSCTNVHLGYTGLICHHKPSITLTYWYTETGAEASVIHKLIAQFEQQNPGITIEPFRGQFLQTRAALATGVRVGEAPDVLRSDIGWVTLFASKGYLLNIDSYISPTDLSDYQRLKAPGGSRLSPLAYDEYDGHLYGLPQVTDCLALLYNEAELKKAGITSHPVTMGDFVRDAEKVVQSKAATYGFETSRTSYYALPFLYAYGGGMFDQQNKILVDKPRSVNGLQFLLNLENNSTPQVMPPKVDFNNGLSNMVRDFMSGRTAMIFDGPWDVSTIVNGSAFRKDRSNLGIAGIPSHAGQTGSPLGGQSYVISAGTAHPAEAYRFISFMSSPSNQAAIAEANHTLPTRWSVLYQDRKVSSDRFISEFRGIWKTEAVARPAIPEGGYLFDAFDPSIWAALVGVQSPEDALKAVADSWKQIGVGQ